MEKDKLYTTFCVTTKRVMKENEIKQRELAPRVGLSESAFTNKINNCGSKFSLAEAVIIAHELAESVEDLAWGRV